MIPELDLPPDQWVKQLVNRAENNTAEYAVDPQIISGLLAHPEQWADVIIWHTHPSGHVGPSLGDMRTRVEGLTYLVVTLPNGEAVLF